MPLEVIRELFVVLIMGAIIIIAMLLFLVVAWKLFVLINKITCAAMDRFQKRNVR